MKCILGRVNCIFRKGSQCTNYYGKCILLRRCIEEIDKRRFLQYANFINLLKKTMEERDEKE